MIFVAVGTQKFPFNRLLKMVDEFAQSHAAGETIFVQTGSSTYIPRHCEHEPFLSKEEFNGKTDACRLMLTHGGAGAITSALKRGKPVIAVPRLLKYGEHVDDHQLQIATAFEKKGMVLVCGDGDSLATVIEKSKDYRFEEYVSQQSRILETICDFLKGVS